MPTVSVKNVPEEVVRRLKAQAQENHRSLQGEVLSILEAATRRAPGMTAAAALAEARRHGLRGEPRSVDIIRADRDRDDRR
jgi:plasmid stability protein